MECTYSLLTFGIPVDEFPFTSQMNLNRKKFEEWIDMRMQIELERRGNQKSVLALQPTHLDVLFGRGRPMIKHPGNISLGILVESMMEQHVQSGKAEKTALSDEIVQRVKERGGRFLRKQHRAGSSDDGKKGTAAAAGGNKKENAGVGAASNSFYWVEANDDMAREKVSHTFRNVRKIEKARQLKLRKKQEGLPVQQPRKKKDNNKNNCPILPRSK